MIRLILLSVMVAGTIPAVLGAPLLTSISGRVVVTTNYYTFNGSNRFDLWYAMTQARPWKTNHNYNATTEWTARSQYIFGVGEDGFRLVKYEAETRVTVTLPRWVPPPEVSPQLLRWWMNFFGALVEHENGHVANAREASAELLREMGALGSFASRQELREATRDTESRVLEKYRSRDRDYDQQTQHGAMP